MTKGKEIIQMVRAAEEAYKQAREQLKKNAKETLQEVFEDLFERHPGLNKVAIRGWTMGWNDGEPCYHQFEVCAAAWQLRTYTWGDRRTYLSTSDMLESEYMREYFEFEEGEGELTATSCNSACTTLHEVEKELESINTLIELVEGTNYDVKAELKDGTVYLDIDYYDCGY